MNDNLNSPVPDNVTEKIIESAMETLNKTVLWIIVSMAILAVSIYGEKQEEKYELFGIKIARDSANIIIFLYLSVINVYVYKLFRTIRDNFGKIEDKAKITFIMRNHPLVTNPFSKSTEKKALVYDYLGYSVLAFLWWAGFNIGFRLFLSVALTKNWHNMLLCLAFALIYGFTGHYTTNIIGEIVFKVNRQKMWKSSRAAIGFVMASCLIIWLNWHSFYKAFAQLF